jgi:cellulose synthase/poly-beta-1,6-N-acetylglucosamine synthase-like glycosyltransferase
MLEGLLVALSQQDTSELFTFSVRVVDNDRHESARHVVSRVAEEQHLSVEYVVETRQNISHARNRALENVCADYVAIIDDDERPERNWLYVLWNSIEQLSADGVLGPVVPEFPKFCPGWLRKSQLCERPSHGTGKWLEYHETRTGNALFRRELFDGIKEAFNPDFGEGGGEDIDFFRRRISEGYRFAWCNEAVIYERVPPERWRLQYYCRRELRLGGLLSSRTRKAGELTFGPILRSTARLIMHGVQMSMRLPFGKHMYARPLVRLCYHAGFLVGAFGPPLSHQREEFLPARECRPF